MRQSRGYPENPCELGINDGALDFSMDFAAVDTGEGTEQLLEPGETLVGTPTVTLPPGLTFSDDPDHQPPVQFVEMQKAILAWIKPDNPTVGECLDVAFSCDTSGTRKNVTRIMRIRIKAG